MIDQHQSTFPIEFWQLGKAISQTDSCALLSILCLVIFCLCSTAPPITAQPPCTSIVTRSARGTYVVGHCCRRKHGVDLSRPRKLSNRNCSTNLQQWPYHRKAGASPAILPADSHRVYVMASPISIPPGHSLHPSSSPVQSCLKT